MQWLLVIVILILRTDKRRLETEIEDKDKKILSLITEMPGPEYNAQVYVIQFKRLFLA